MPILFILFPNQFRQSFSYSFLPSSNSSRVFVCASRACSFPLLASPNLLIAQFLIAVVISSPLPPKSCLDWSFAASHPKKWRQRRPTEEEMDGMKSNKGLKWRGIGEGPTRAKEKEEATAGWKGMDGLDAAQHYNNRIGGIGWRMNEWLMRGIGWMNERTDWLDWDGWIDTGRKTDWDRPPNWIGWIRWRIVEKFWEDLLGRRGWDRIDDLIGLKEGRKRGEQWRGRHQFVAESGRKINCSKDGMEINVVLHWHIGHDIGKIN